MRKLKVHEGDWLSGKRLVDYNLPDEGISVLGVHRGDDNSFVGAPRGDTELYPGDTLLLYGRVKMLRELEGRRRDFSGDQAHRKSVTEQKIYEAEQEEKEMKHRRRRKEKERDAQGSGEEERGRDH